LEEIGSGEGIWLMSDVKKREVEKIKIKNFSLEVEARSFKRFNLKYWCVFEY
jgi:hypothetical protein